MGSYQIRHPPGGIHCSQCYVWIHCRTGRSFFTDSLAARLIRRHVGLLPRPKTPFEQICNNILTYYTYIYIPGTCLSSCFGFEPFKRRTALSIQNKGHLGSRYETITQVWNIYESWVVHSTPPKTNTVINMENHKKLMVGTVDVFSFSKWACSGSIGFQSLRHFLLGSYCSFRSHRYIVSSVPLKPSPDSSLPSGRLT